MLYPSIPPILLRPDLGEAIFEKSRVWQTHRRIAGEKPKGHQRKPHMMTGHHRPFFRPHNVRDSRHIPYYKIIIADHTVFGGPLWQPVIHFIAGGISPRRIFLPFLVLSDPY